MRWEALSAKGELRGGLKRNEAEQPQPRLLWQPNIIHRYNQRKPKAVPFPEIHYFRMGWTPGKINIVASLLPSFSCIRSASQSTDYQDGERLGHSLRVSQRLGGLSAHDKKHRQSILGKCHPYPIKNAQEALITH